MVRNLLSSLLLFLIPLGASAYTFALNNIYYDLKIDGTCDVTYFDTSDTRPYTGKVEIPSSISMYGEVFSVTGIGDYAFENCTALTSVTIPSSVTTIGDYAFHNCSGLTTVTIPSSVTSIGNWAFLGCSGLTSITIPSTTTSIGERAFGACSKLQAFIVEEGNTAYASENGLLFNADKTTLVAVPAKASSVSIPSTVTTIGNWALANCSGLTTLSIPATVKTLGDYAFYDCSGLTTVTIPNTVTSIGSDVFSHCSALTTVSMPESMTSIPDGMFSRCSALTTVTIPSTVTTIGANAFLDCSALTALTIPANVTTIGDAAFSSCAGLTSLTFPGSVQSIGNYALAGCTKLRRVESLAEVPPTCSAYTFTDFETGKCKLVVLKNSLAAYEAADGWKDFLEIAANTYDVAIDELCYVTRCFADNVDLNGSGLTAYVVSDYDDATATLTEVTGIVPAGVGMILYAATEGTYTLTATTATATDANLNGNKLKGVLTNTELEPGTAYVLADDGASNVEFALLSDDAGTDGGNVVPANRAYLPVISTATASGQTLSFTFGTPTGIDGATLDADDADTTWYTLGGVAVKNPSKGIYVNSKGKVVLFK